MQLHCRLGAVMHKRDLIVEPPSLVDQMVKESAYRKPMFHPWVGKIPGEGNDNPFQYSFLENPMTEEPGGPQSLGCKESDMTWLSD